MTTPHDVYEEHRDEIEEARRLLQAEKEDSTILVKSDTEVELIFTTAEEIDEELLAQAADALDVEHSAADLWHHPRSDDSEARIDISPDDG